MGANERQVAGGHYVRYGKLQVWDAWWHWGLDPFQANILKYVIRTKGDIQKRIEDLDKALHYLEKLTELITESEFVDWLPVSILDLNDHKILTFDDAAKSWKLDKFQWSIMHDIVCCEQDRPDRLTQLREAANLIEQYKEHLQTKKENNNEV